MREFNLKEEKVSNLEEEIKPIPIRPKSNGPSLMQKLTNIMFVAICAIIVIFALRVFNHVRILNNYSIPEDALSEITVDESVDDSEVNYVDEVVYNPSNAGNKLANAQNNYILSSDINDLEGESPWYSGDSEMSYSWKFMSGYDFKSAKIDCVWLCTSIDGKTVYAYHTARYNGIEDTFEDAYTFLTKEGGGSLAHD